jgi:pilus assembly protein CpaC
VHSDKFRLCVLLAGIAALALSPASALAQEIAPAEVSVHAGTVEIPLNKSQVVTANVPIDRAMIGNPEIADILPVSDRSVYVLGKKIGTTSLTLYDRANRVIAVMDIAVGPDVIALREQLRQLMPGQPLFAEMSNDSIVLVGTARDAGTADRAVQLARAFAGEDKVVNLMTLEGSQQVMLEVRFAEVSRDIGKDLRSSMFFRSNGGAFSGAIGNGAQLTPDPDTGAGVLGLEAITGSFGIFRRVFTDVAGLSIESVLDTLEERGMSKTLAEPTLIALSGQRASFLAGGEFPIPVVQSGAGAGPGGTQSITVEFKPFGVSLGFTPTVLSGNVINLLVEPEVSAIDPTASITLNGLTIPGLQTRRASTVLELRDGESFAIAGLLQRDFSTTIRQIPLLGQLPVIGTLFRSTEFQKGETELLIVVTPRLVAPIRPEQVQLPTDRVADPYQADVLINSEEYVPVDLPPIPGANQPPAATDPNAPDAQEPDYDF